MLGDKPLTGGGVQFHSVVEKGSNEPISIPLGAKLEEDGSYSLKVPVGRYRVELGRGDNADKQLWSQLAPKYMSPKSPLLVEVTEDKPSGGYDLKITPGVQQKRR